MPSGGARIWPSGSLCRGAPRVLLVASDSADVLRARRLLSPLARLTVVASLCDVPSHPLERWEAAVVNVPTSVLRALGAATFGRMRQGGHRGPILVVVAARSGTESLTHVDAVLLKNAAGTYSYIQSVLQRLQ